MTSPLLKKGELLCENPINKELKLKNTVNNACLNFRMIYLLLNKQLGIEVFGSNQIKATG